MIVYMRKSCCACPASPANRKAYINALRTRLGARDAYAHDARVTILVPRDRNYAFRARLTLLVTARITLTPVIYGEPPCAGATVLLVFAAFGNADCAELAAKS